MVQFSQQLRNKLIEYLKNHRGITITSEQADEYLNSMADLYRHFLIMI